MPRFSLIHKVLIAFIAILLPILATIFFIFQENRREMKSLLSAQLVHIADEREAYILMYLDMNKDRIIDFASDDFIVRTLEKMNGATKEKVGYELSDYMVKYKLPLLTTMHRLNIITAMDGTVVASTLPGYTGEKHAKEEFFKSGMKSISVMDIVSNGKPELVVSAPIRSRRDPSRIIGVITGFYELFKFGEFFTGEYIKSLGAISWDPGITAWKTFEIYLVNRDKLMLTKSRFIKDSVLKVKVDSLPVRSCLQSGKEVAGIYHDYRGKEVVGASTCFPSLGWTLLAEVDEEEVFEPLIQDQRHAIILVSVVVLLIGALVLFFVRLIITQLRRLAYAAGDISAGHYDTKIPVTSRDEIGWLAASFNEMILRIKERTAELEKSQRSLQEAQRIARVGNWEWDLINNKLYASEEFYRIFGTGTEDKDKDLGFYLENRVHPEDRSNLKALIEELQVKGGLSSSEFRIVLPGGKEKNILAQMEAAYDETGRIIKLFGTVQDITERKRAEEEVRRLNIELEKRVEERTAELKNAIGNLAAANKDLETFTYSVAHDLRAPLRIIDGFSLLVLKNQKERLDTEGQDDINRIRASVGRMGRLIDDLLNFFYVMRVDINYRMVDITELALSILSDLQKSDPERAVDVKVQNGMKARGDERLIRMVIENLIGNAWKYTLRKETAYIEFGSYTERGKEVFYVKDNGIGFDMKYSEKIFEPFQRLHSADEFPGTGIGLATVRRIIQRHGGSTWAESEPGKGAVFYFTLKG